MFVTLALVWMLGNDSFTTISEPNMPSIPTRLEGFYTYQDHQFLRISLNIYQLNEANQSARLVAPDATYLSQTTNHLYATGSTGAYIWNASEQTFETMPDLKGHSKAFGSTLYVYRNNRLTLIDDQTGHQRFDLDTDLGTIQDVVAFNQRVYLLMRKPTEHQLVEIHQGNVNVITTVHTYTYNAELYWDAHGLWYIDAAFGLHHIDQQGNTSLITEELTNPFLVPFNEGVVYSKERYGKEITYFNRQNQEMILYEGSVTDYNLTDDFLVFQTPMTIQSLSRRNELTTLVETPAFAPAKKPSLQIHDSKSAYFWTKNGLLESDGTIEGSQPILSQMMPSAFDSPLNRFRPQVFTGNGKVYHTQGPNNLDEGLYRIEAGQSIASYLSPIKRHSFSPLILDNHFLNLTYLDNLAHLQLTPIGSIDPNAVQTISLKTSLMYHCQLYELNGQALIRRSTATGFDYQRFQVGDAEPVPIPGLPTFPDAPSIRQGNNKVYLHQKNQTWVISGNPLKAREVAASYFYDDSGSYLSHEVSYVDTPTAYLFRNEPDSVETLYTFQHAESIMRLEWHEAADALYILLSTSYHDILYRAEADQEPVEIFSATYGTPDYETRFFRFLPIEDVVYFTNNHALYKIENGEATHTQEWQSYGGPIISFNDHEPAYYMLANDTAFKLERDYLTQLDFERPSYNDFRSNLGGNFNDSGDAFLVQNSYRSGFRDVTYISPDLTAKSLSLPSLMTWPELMDSQIYYGAFDQDQSAYTLVAWDGISDSHTDIESTPYINLYFHKIGNHLVVNGQDKDGKVHYKVLNYTPKPTLHVASFGQVYLVQTETIHGARYDWERNDEPLANPQNRSFYYLFGKPGDRINLRVTLADGRHYTNSSILPDQQPIPVKTTQPEPIGIRF